MTDSITKPRHPGGRKKGGRNKVNKETLKIAKRVEMRKKGNVMPLEYMLTRMNDESAPRAERNYMAVSAAPYCHTKQTNLNISSNASLSVNFAGREMTLEEMQASYRQILSASPEDLLKTIEGEAVRLVADQSEDEEA
jgi:hypothetical protein